jgi:hypothetical protein
MHGQRLEIPTRITEALKHKEGTPSSPSSGHHDGTSQKSNNLRHGMRIRTGHPHGTAAPPPQPLLVHLKSKTSTF